MVLVSSGFILFDILLIVAGAALAFFVYFKHSYQYWKKRGVPYLEPKFPHGNNTYLFAKSAVIGAESKVWYNALKKKGHKFGGVWALSRPVLVLVDPDYIKDVLTQDFHYFINRDVFSNEKWDPRGTHLFNVKDEAWKPLRQKLTPTFTSGKMKMMFHNIVNCSNAMVGYLDKCAKMGDDIDIREVLASFTTDVIGCVAFGVDCNSFHNTHAEFRKQGREMFRVRIRDFCKIVLIKYFPELSSKLRLASGKTSSKEFFGQVVKGSIEYRKKSNIKRPDFLQLLIDMNEETQSQEKPFTFDQIVANTILFFIAGFDTSSTTMNFALYELARNPDIQEKTRQEIQSVLKKHNGELTYEAIQDMTYLRQVLDETLRLYPAVVSLGRICTKDYQLRDTNITIEKGTPVLISPLGLGRDPNIYPDPEKFDPDRFSSENKANRHPYTHIPFGEGPRNCIGLRFGIMQSKIGVLQVLKNYRISISPKTKMPLTIDQTIFLLKSNETLYLKAEKL